MRKTKDLKLDLLEPTDPVSAAPLNANAAALDAAVAADRAANAAVAAELRGAVAALAANLGGAGHNCRICWGSYKGTGTYGEANPIRLTFPFEPVLVLVGSAEHAHSSNCPTILLKGCDLAHGNTMSSGSTFHVTWRSKGVSWYSGSSAPVNNNTSGRIYYYVALGYDAEAEG